MFHQKRILFSIAFLCLLAVATGLCFVFAGDWVLAQSVRLGPLNLRYYGITMALAVGAGWWLALRRASRYGFTSQQTDSLLQWVVAGGFVGARLYHVASSWQYYWQYPVDILKVWHGGLSIFGALIGGFVVLLIWTWRSKLFTFHPSLFTALDWLIPSVVLGQIIGRFGNFFNYEAFGYPASVPWKMFVPPQFRPEQLAQSSFFHPLFLYEALGNAFILIILLNWETIVRFCHSGLRAGIQSRRWIPDSPRGLVASGMTEPGKLFFLYLFLYNALRFVIEFWRVDSTFLWGIIRLNTLSSAVLCVVGIAGLVLGAIVAGRPTSPSKPKS